MVRVSRTDRTFHRGLVPLLALVSAAACGGSDGASSASLTQPSVSLADGLTGTWSGSASDSSGPGRMSWQITQTGTSFSGTATLTDSGTALGGRGSVSGTVSNGSIHFSITIPAGGFDSPYASCAGEVSGDGQSSTASIAGTYSGSNSCTGAITSGQLTLNRQ
jgi:hypothetical protein